MKIYVVVRDAEPFGEVIALFLDGKKAEEDAIKRKKKYTKDATYFVEEWYTSD